VQKSILPFAKGITTNPSESLKSLFDRLEAPEKPDKKPISKKSGLLGRLGKR
jgi:hypothetical protein